MTSFSESVSDFNALEAGLAAIQQGKPIEAVSLLESYLDTQVDLNPRDVLKAQMGLVRSYLQIGRKPDAIALCQRLTQSDHEKVRSWASRMLSELEPPNQTGFVPLEGEVKKRRVFVSPQSKPQSSEVNEAIEPCMTLGSPPNRSEKIDPTDVDNQPLSDRAPTLQTFVQTFECVQTFEWRQAERAHRWQPLKSLNPARLQWSEIGTAIALFSLVYELCAIIGSIPYLWFRFRVDILRQSAVIPDTSIPVWFLLGILTALFVASPWILDAVLKFGDGMRFVTTAEIARSSPETHRLLQRFCQQRKIPIPKLGVIPIQAPISFTYGCLPKFARMIVSQGLLEQLADDEIAAIYASELGHIAHWNFCWMSWVAVVLQIPYTVYRQGAIAADWLYTRARKQDHLMPKLLTLGADLLAVLSALSYGLFWVLRWSGLWLSKQRIQYSDRHACNLTGNPNGLARALLKIAIATAQTIQTEQKTDEVLEGFELLAPIGYRNALTVGSFINQVPLNSLLAWDQVNVDRHWLTLNNSHPLMGERFAKIMSYASQWQLDPEIALESPSVFRTRKRIFQQGAPFWGSAIGLGIALALWVVAHLAFRLGYDGLNWLASDYKLFASFMLLGFGLGTILRFNRFFPELRQPETFSVTDLLTQPDLIPADSRSLCLKGVLLGRSGTSNGLAQDLILQTADGFIKLHFTSQLGAIGNLLPARTRPIDLIGQPVTISGWFRRGATPWIDVETLKTVNHPLVRSGHQVWSAIAAFSTILMGLILIL